MDLVDFFPHLGWESNAGWLRVKLAPVVTTGRSLSILHVHTLPVVSGSGINTLLTLKGSLARGHRVALACASEGRLTEKSREAGASIFLAARLCNVIDPLRDLPAVAALARLMRRERFDLVHTHNSKAGFIGRLAARLARIPVVIHTVHGFAFHDAEAALRQTLFRNLERLAARWCDGMIFISQPLVDWARRERIGIRVPQALIYSGIDIDAFRTARGEPFRARLGIPPGRLVVGMVSKLWEGKGHDVLLRAWKGVLERLSAGPRPLLAIVGEGYLEGSLKARTSELGLQDSVIFTGFQEDVPGVTAAIDIAVLPSLFEGMGRVILEAMAAGKPVVASRTGGIPDLVRHDDNGLLVPPGDADALQAALLEVLSSQSLRARLAEGARAALRPEHSAAWMVDQIHQFYQRVMVEKTSAR
ncbi:MAG: glycosyltransferase family 4 protein [Acidobacteria bacterium]|nr:glycosyltransferase family 4 protein [Acidobacteriota bacterium]